MGSKLLPRALAQEAAAPACPSSQACMCRQCWPHLWFAAVFLTVMSLLLTLHPQFLLTISPVFPLTTPLFPLDSGAFPLTPAVTILSSWSPGGYCLLCAFALVCEQGRPGRVAPGPRVGHPRGPLDSVRALTWSRGHSWAFGQDSTETAISSGPGLGKWEGWGRGQGEITAASCRDALQAVWRAPLRSRAAARQLRP